ncbi:MAG: hypothetical protein FWE71_01065 [Nocardioidaceae bacterium]|nr:hypothetical protein [Nocardioidaceae bacterium]MCL2612713.1 hypothetical protein [Nocardioidaceae bacterium]
MDDVYAPFYESNSFCTAEDALNAVVMLHESGGIDQLTMSAVARHLNMSRSAVHQAHGSVTGFYVSLIGRFERRWRDWIAGGYTDPTPIRLPGDPMAHLGVRTWSTLRTVAAAEARAGRPEPWEEVARALERERRHLGDSVRKAAGRRAEAHEVAGLLALADGLRAQMTEPTDPLGLEDATDFACSYWTGVLHLPLLTVDDAC